MQGMDMVHLAGPHPMDPSQQVVTQQPFRRSQAACLECRTGKTRCIHDRSLHASCVRCQRFGLQCTYPIATKKRGRPPKSSQVDSEGNPLPSIRRMTSSSDTSNYLPTISNDWMVSSNGDQKEPFNPFNDPLSTSDHSTNNTTSTNGFSMLPQQPQQRHSFAVPALPGQPLASTSTSSTPATDTSTANEGDRNVNMAEYLDPADRYLQTNPPKVPFFTCQPGPTDRMELVNASGQISSIPAEPDPISLGMLSEAEARLLVSQFHEHLNHHIAVLDAKLHTLEYLRQTSSILLSVVLAAASKAYRKDLVAQLLSHANIILDRALTRGITHISLMQSLMILTYTKAPADTSAWRRIGMAIRMGYQIYCHVPRTAPLPSDEMAARVLLNTERTWFCLFCFDRGLGHVFGLPYTIRLNEIGNVETWAREHIHLGKSVDMHLAASIDLCRLKDQWRAIFDAQSPSPSYCEAAIENLKIEGEALYTKWFRKGSVPPGFDSETEHVIAWCILDFLFTLKRQHHELAPNVAMRLDACLSIASQIVDEIEMLGKKGTLGIMQDTASCMTSSLGIFFHKVFWTSTAVQKSLMVSLLQRVLASHVAVVGGDEKSAPAHVVRCIKRILGAICAESRAGSPSLDPTNQEPLQDLYMQLEEFMGPTENLASFGDGDEQFWQMLFSA